jgi:hypothetical protein
VGKQLILSVDVGSGVIRLKRLTVTAHTAKRITVTVPGGWTLQAGEYAVVDVNAKWQPGAAITPRPCLRVVSGHPRDDERLHQPRPALLDARATCPRAGAYARGGDDGEDSEDR